MLLTLIISAAAGYAAKIVEPRILELLLGFIGEDTLPDAADRRVASLLICLLAAGLVIALGFGSSSVFVFALGAFLGYFQEQIREAILKQTSKSDED